MPTPSRSRSWTVSATGSLSRVASETGSGSKGVPSENRIGTSSSADSAASPGSLRVSEPTATPSVTTRLEQQRVVVVVRSDVEVETVLEEGYRDLCLERPVGFVQLARRERTRLPAVPEWNEEQSVDVAALAETPGDRLPRRRADRTDRSGELDPERPVPGA